MPARKLRVSAPGRICLFGEHQDYLGLPVVAAAVDMRVTLDGVRTDRPELLLDLVDTGARESIPLDAPISYRGPRDYLRSVLKVLREEGFEWDGGWDITMRGEIPIGKGCSSSSAMAVAWIAFLAFASRRAEWLPPERAARLANRAEVLEFGEPGGMMDHFASAVGGLIHVPPHGESAVEPLETIPDCVFVLGDSLEPKATTAVLARVKNTVLEGLELLRKKIPGADIARLTAEETERALRDAPEPVLHAVLGNIRNREITREGLALLKNGSPDTEALGALLTEEHGILRDALGISTPRVETLVAVSLAAGAWGAKINGSGGGGCMFAACAPDSAECIAAAIRNAGGEARILKTDVGVRREDA